MLRAYSAAMPGSSAVTVPTWYSGSSYLRRASTTQAVRSEGFASSRTPLPAGRARRVPLPIPRIVIPRSPVHASWSGPSRLEVRPAGRPRPAAAPQLRHELGVGGAARLPAAEHLVPGARALLVQPALVRRVEAGRERHLEHVLLPLLVEVGRDLQADLLAERHHLAHPGLPQLVVALALEAVLQLLGVALLGVGEAEPFDREHEHPVHRPLQPGLLLGVLHQAADPLLAVAEVEGLLLVHLGQRPLPRPEGGRVVHVAQQLVAGL